MSETKAMPGPWTLEEIERPFSLVKWSIRHHWENDTRGMTGTGIVAGGSDTVAYLMAADANASLIASAPDLLAALKALTEKVDAVGANQSFLTIAALGSIHGQPYDGPTWRDELIAARDAIAKAEGR